MTKKRLKWMLYLLILLIVIPLTSSWTGPPPADIVYYGYAYINGSAASAGTTVEILANGGALVMDSGTTIIGGYFPNLQMVWDDPDTGTDEGITYGNNAENIYFKIAGQTTNYPQYITATTSQAGQSIEINISYIYNFPPVLDFIPNQVFTEDVNKCFNITASDNDTYRQDTLTYSDAGAPTSVSKINNTLAQVCWTAGNSQVGNHTYTYTVTDDGLPQESDNQSINIEVLNVNDAPYINLADKTTLVNQTFTYDVSAVSGDIDPTGDSLNYTDNTTLFEIGLTSGLINFTPTSAGVYGIKITVTDNWGASSSDTFTLTILEEEKVVIRKNIYYETTSSGVVYTITNKIYNFLGSDITNAPFTDPDIGYNGTVSITNEKNIEITGNITLSQSGQTHLFNGSTLTVGSRTYSSNQPRIILPGATTTSTSGGGGGSSGPCPPCPACPPTQQCEACPICPEPTQELEELPEEIPEEIPKEDYLAELGLSGLIALIIVLIITRWFYLRYSVKRNLKFILQRGNNYHFILKKQRFSVKLLNLKTMKAAVYTKRKNKEFIGRTMLNKYWSCWKYSWRAFSKIKSGTVKTRLVLKNIKNIIKEQSLKTLNKKGE